MKFTSSDSCVLVLVLTAFVAGCSGEDPLDPKGHGAPASTSAGTGGGGGAGGGGSGGDERGGDDTTWAPCALRPNEDQDGAECAIVDLPLDYGEPEGETLGVQVKRVRATKPSVGQVWLLHGGPGGSGVDDMASLAGELFERRPDLDYYTLDHRGVGGSGRLRCPAQESAASPGGRAITNDEVPECLAAIEREWGEKLDFITITDSARDVGTLIERFRDPSKRVFVWGGSYGTYLAARYLHLYPEQPSGVILEGIEPPSGSFDDYDVKMNAAAEKLMAVCGADPSCQSHFSAAPWTIAQQVVASFDQGHCPALGVGADEVRTFLGGMLFFAPIRDLIPAMVHRFERCSDADVDVLLHFADTYYSSVGFGPEPGNTGSGGSRALFFHIALSEMWGQAGKPDPQDVISDWETTTMSTGLTVGVAGVQDIWPTYPHDGYTWKFPEYDGPLLMLQGELDPATVFPDASEMKDHYAAAHQTFAAFSTGAHNIRGGTPTSDGKDCGNELTAAFLENPEQSLDPSCLSKLLPIDFDGTASINAFLLGVTDAWDGM